MLILVIGVKHEAATDDGLCGAAEHFPAVERGVVATAVHSLWADKPAGLWVKDTDIGRCTAGEAADAQTEDIGRGGSDLGQCLTE